MTNKQLAAFVVLVTLVIMLAFGTLYWYLRWRQVDDCDTLAEQLQGATIDCSAGGKKVILITSCCKYADSVIQDWMMDQGCIVESVTEPPPVGSCDWTYEYIVDGQ